MALEEAEGVVPGLGWQPIPMVEIETARERTSGTVLRAPLVRFDADDIVPSGTDVFLKLECLQPVRSFKVRGAYNAMAKAGRAALADGVWTVSSGNMAQAVAWSARALGIPCSVYVPDDVPRTKLANVVRYGGTPVELPRDELGPIFVTGQLEGAPGSLIHPYSDPDVIAGNGVIGLEILEDLPAVDAVVVPFGGGGLITGIASVIKVLRPQVKIYASEMDTGAPLAGSLAAGHPVEVDFIPSFADGISDPWLDPAMFDIVKHFVDGSIVVNRKQTADAMRLAMERNKVIVEGAGATAIAAAMSGQAGTGRIACIASGGNVDAKTLLTILKGATPD